MQTLSNTITRVRDAYVNSPVFQNPTKASIACGLAGLAAVGCACVAIHYKLINDIYQQDFIDVENFLNEVKNYYQGYFDGYNSTKFYKSRAAKE